MCIQAFLVGVCLLTSTSVEVRSIDFDSTPDRRWPGAGWYVNRVQDWRVADGNLVCEDSRLPVRTAHVLPVRIEPSKPTAPITISTTIVPVGGGAVDAGAFGGILLGAGNADVDYRLTALVQQVPAPDGGLLAVVDGQGKAQLLDFSTPRKGGFSWTLPRNTSLETLKPLAEAGKRVGAGRVDFTKPVELRVTIWPNDQHFDLILEVRSAGKVVNTITANGLQQDAIDGGLALVSHRARKKQNLGWRFNGLTIDTEDPAGWLDENDERTWGPVLAVMYTIDRGATGHFLALNALFPPSEENQLGEVVLEAEAPDGSWMELDTNMLQPDSFTVPFTTLQIDEYLGKRYRVRGEYDGEPFEWIGELRSPPPGDREMVIAHLNCVKNVVAHKAWNRQGVWFPHDDLLERVMAHDPDLVYCAGDQIYEGDLSGVDGPKRLLDYHTKYQRWLWSFGELLRDRPSIVIPDDHDVFHGNIWGAGGIRAVAKDGLTVQDAGGYKLPADIVNAIHRTQVGHLPECLVFGPIGQGIDPYTTRLRWGSIDAAIVADRMWKDSASVLVPEGKVRNGWFKNPEFDPRDSDVETAEFLGHSQEMFLEDWAADRDPASPRKLVLSQTPWINVATLPQGNDDGVVPGLKILAAGEYAENDMPAADTDSGGWPQGARALGVRFIDKADAIHLTGDQHLATLVQYGVKDFRDGPFVFTGPAVANTFPRRWMPKEGGANRAEGAPRYTGDFLDGFGNMMTVWAVANPTDRHIEPRRLFDLSPGYGIVRVDPNTGNTVLEAWPRWSDSSDSSQQFEGWPFTVPSRVQP